MGTSESKPQRGPEERKAPSTSPKRQRPRQNDQESLGAGLDEMPAKCSICKTEMSVKDAANHLCQKPDPLPSIGQARNTEEEIEMKRMGETPQLVFHGERWTASQSQENVIEVTDIEVDLVHSQNLVKQPEKDEEYTIPGADWDLFVDKDDDPLPGGSLRKEEEKKEEEERLKKEEKRSKEEEEKRLKKEEEEKSKKEEEERLKKEEEEKLKKEEEERLKKE
eukprot:CAMPEP_0201511904 /NCGR_PEP_ID=MMETSP0161_2-20130828/4279_1 /ASSEMBLY_ACC=CAM_ASM_000251 /TAXON_ID=180227 /ORGANISM="Neoparamoeba aestuarina, Strain SoJaBio B1-5/56/2" /LENGTH=221 /DNA_ID=CAMNT_0047907565 /DNA_START=113 /DNA_END=775 /DNA_ORIENTATION=+